jgi:3-dehydrosphinganine reductase
VARDPVKMAKVKASIEGASCHVADVADLESVKGAAGSILSEGPLDLLVNSAGISHPGRFLETDPSVSRRTIDVNLIGTMNCCHAFIPGMRSGGHIANVGSIAGILGFYGYGAYSASKFGIMGFSEALRMEMAEKGIGVSVVLPPDTRTPQLKHEDTLKPPETRRISSIIPPRSPEWVAERILDAIKARRFVTVLTVEGRFVHLATRVAPSITRWYIDRRIASR